MRWCVLLFCLRTTLLVEATAETKRGLPRPDSAACINNGPSSDDVKLCDPDSTLPDYNQPLTNDLLTKCENSSQGATVFLVLIDQIDSYVHTHKKQHEKIDELERNAISFYNLTTRESVLFMLAAKEPLQVKIWRSESLMSKLPSAALEEAENGMNQTYLNYRDFPSSVREFVWTLCKHLQEDNTGKTWGVTDWLLIIFICIYVGIIVTLTVLMVRGHLKRLDAPSSVAGEFRSVPGRHHQQNPLSLELHEYGAMATYTSTGHILLSTTDVAAVNTSSSSTENLIDT